MDFVRTGIIADDYDNGRFHFPSYEDIVRKLLCGVLLCNRSQIKAMT